jgi:ParB family chromosome partitioning protein
MADSIAWKSLAADRQKLIRLLPKRGDELLAWLLQQESGVTSNLLAFCVASTVDGISGTDTPHPINEVANVLNVDMSRYWKHARASYFDHVSTQRIVDVVATTVSAQAGAILAGLKSRTPLQGPSPKWSNRGRCGSASSPRCSRASHLCRLQ